MARKDLERNRLYVVQGHDHPWLLSNRLQAQDASWVAGRPPEARGYGAKTRRQADAACRLEDAADGRFSLVFPQAQWAVTPGQSAVLYDGDICLGGVSLPADGRPAEAGPARATAQHLPRAGVHDQKGRDVDVTMVICLLALGAAAGFAAGLLGIGGGMVLVPFLTMLFSWKGMPADTVVHAAIATSMTSILFTSISSVRAHQQRGTIKWGIVAAMAPGIIIGGLLSGGAVFAALSSHWLSLFFALFVGYSGWSMLRNKKSPAARCPASRAPARPAWASVSCRAWWAPAALSVPFMVWCNVALHNAVSTSAALGFPIALANSAGYVVSGLNESVSRPGMLGYIYWPALIALVCASVLTALGARMASPAGGHAEEGVRLPAVRAVGVHAVQGRAGV